MTVHCQIASENDDPNRMAEDGKRRQTKTAMYVNVIRAVQLYISTKMSTSEKVGGTKHRASPPLKKVGGTCPPVHPRIYAHASKK